MKGFRASKKGASLERVRFDISEISLLARGNGAEVLLQSIEKNKLFYIYPSDNPNAMEFYFILSGEVTCEIDGEKLIFGPQDHFTAQGLTDPIHFTTLSDITFLWVVTEPVFVHVSKEMSSLMDIVKKVEEKDRYTYMHSDRVAEYAVKIAKQMKLDTVQLELITQASYLHDIGKIHIPESVLNKPSRLTDEEFAVIKKHPADGAEMLKGTVYEELCPIIAQHHERLDGRGYPFGLTKNDILLEAKIIAVSDTYDAMTEDRAYRKAFNAQYALDEIRSLVGTHYDKEVVEAFEKVLIEEGKI
ncbi:HD-GYP domain-containing protein [Planomicrobium sp. CPCC 101110]|uniref:HD-GYP domain-containing protein n=1 Tax=Planomicrobium sp. CPCC 101110 TaxID=2599619 RepID=UPI0011B52536|nr:HD-GYP domain-containing protein [Planomicrobium sp. CPCC 101110]TWT25228.1 HD domain-containing protein [Planomicrobium sp. CPCC 101110]